MSELETEMSAFRSDAACAKCGSTEPADWQCSRCGGHGLVETMGGPDDCPDCGCSGIAYPPRCPNCSAFRKAIPSVTP